MKYALTLFLIICSFSGYSQSADQVRYYLHAYDTDEMRMDKAKYVRHTRTNDDGSITDEWQNIRTHAIVKSETTKDGIPTGIWIYANDHGTGEQRYDFTSGVSYTPIECKSEYEMRLGASRLADSITGTFDAPVVNGQRSYNDALAYNLRYPEPARDAGLQGKVVIKGMLTKDGRLVNLYIADGRRNVLDAEAMRVMKSLSFRQPARVNGKPVDVCVTIPITFALD